MDLYSNTPNANGSPALLRALRFLWRHRETMTVQVEDEINLRVRPTSLAREHADEIRELKPYLMRLCTPSQWTPELATSLMGYAHNRNAGLLRGQLVEVIEFAQIDRPELWEQVGQEYVRIDEAYRDQDWKAFSRALCRHMDLYDEMLEAYKTAEAA